MTDMRAWLAAAMLALVPAPQPASAPVPVLVELFTSEGCSSCPPADRLLTVLLNEQPIAGATVVALGLHVDYWDDLGWKDPASSAEATRRQQSYGNRFGSDRVYTPQMVVDGRSELVGSDAREVQKAVERAIQLPHARLTPRTVVEGTAIVATVTVSDVPQEALKKDLQVGLAITEDGLSTVVKRGENNGRTLHHDAVVREIARLGGVKNGKELTFRIPLRPDWRRDRLNAVFFLQDKSQRIWGAALRRIG